MGLHLQVEKILSTSGLLFEKDKENYYLGVSLIELGKFSEGIEYLTKYVKYHRKNYIPFVKLGYAYYAQEMYDRALKAYNQAKTLNPSSQEINDSVKLCLEKLGSGGYPSAN